MSEPNVQHAAEVLFRADRDWEYLSDEEKRGTIDEALEALTESGEREAESPVTGETYRVTRWIDQGDGKMTALAKEPIQE